MVLALFAACNKNDLQNSGPDKPVAQFKADTSVVLPGSFVVLTSDQKPAKDSFRVLLGTTSVVLLKTDSNKMTFQVPVLPAGMYKLNLKAAGGQDSLALIIAPYTPVANPAAYLGQLQTTLQQLTDSLGQYQVSGLSTTAELSFIRQLQVVISRSMNSLSADQQQLLALLAQQAAFDSRSVLPFADTTYVIQRTTQQADPAALLEQELNQALQAYQTLQPLATQAGLLSKLWMAGARNSDGITYQLVTQLYTIQKLRLRLQVHRASNVAGIASGEFLTTNGSGTTAQPLQAVRGRSVVQQFRARFRTLEAGDGALLNGKAGALFQNTAQLTTNDQLLGQQWQQVKTRFGTALSDVQAGYPLYQNPIPAQSKSKLAPVPAGALTITNVSHSKIAVTAAVEPGNALRLSFSSSDSLLAEGTPFTFQVTYSQPLLQRTVTFTEQALFQNYASVTIGTQVWMSENLAVTKFRNGDNIPYVGWGPTWATLKTPAWCFYNNDPATVPVYGLLYNWYAVGDPRGLAPAGWHVARKAEWTNLVAFTGGGAAAGGALKAVSPLWVAPNTGATNSSGFTALPGGMRGNGGTYVGLGLNGGWWTADAYGPNGAWFYSLSNNQTAVYVGGASKQDGYSVRCIRD